MLHQADTTSETRAMPTRGQRVTVTFPAIGEAPEQERHCWCSAVWPDGSVDLEIDSDSLEPEMVGDGWTLFPSEVASGVAVWAPIIEEAA